MLKRDDTRENYPAKNMGKEQDQESFEVGSSIKISQGNDLGSESQGKYSADFSITKIEIFTSNILFFHNSLYEKMFL